MWAVILRYRAIAWAARIRAKLEVWVAIARAHQELRRSEAASRRNGAAPSRLDSAATHCSTETKPSLQSRQGEEAGPEGSADPFWRRQVIAFM